ncbi:hypothetical protein [Mycobacterium sp. OTB74]|jgi:hypothetical protein|uniref:hypothetical protein n=1 Tax=Mycobacterium sp. OTB74 TaxID=1853452 RepID=UPI00247669E4|nr:hypothetical protein [Mycobacterium sp. OTB74]MDH6246683.1 hypothetical protein [Mycobacterium sp. OTB74]
MSYRVIDLVYERANEKDWDLIFDSGPNGDLQTVIWEHPLLSAAGLVTELEIVFSPDGRIISAEKRHGETSYRRISSPDTFTSTDICVRTLQLMASPRSRRELTKSTRDERLNAVVDPFWAAIS